jgi:hypothetical protein
LSVCKKTGDTPVAQYETLQKLRKVLRKRARIVKSECGDDLETRDGKIAAVMKKYRAEAEAELRSYLGVEGGEPASPVTPKVKPSPEARSPSTRS